MVDFELKIFANPSGFKELQLNNTQELFTQDLVSFRAYDAERDTFKAGAYSVLFTPACYIVSYQFDVPNEVNFRGATAILAIAVRREKRINDIISVFTDLRGKVNKALVEVGYASIHIKLNEFNEMIQQNIQDDFDQLLVNSADIKNIKRALVGYKAPEQLKHLLEVPNRRKFDGYNLVFLVPSAEAQNIWESIKNKYDAIIFSDPEFEYKTSYEVVFPDGHTEIVSGRDSEVNYTTHKPYYQNLPFIGKLSDYLELWQVRQSDDKTQFIIDIKLEPDKLIFNVRLLDGDGNLLSENIVLKSSNIGTYNSHNHELTLIGDEIESRSLVKLNPEAANRKIASQIWDGDVYYVRFAKVYHYNLTSIFQSIKQQSGEDGVIILCSKSNNKVYFTNQSAIQDLEIPFENTCFDIQETRTTEKLQIFFQSDGSLRENVKLIRKKPTIHKQMPPTPGVKSENLKVTFKVEDQTIAEKGLELKLEYYTEGESKDTSYKSNEAIIKSFSRRTSTSMSYTVTIKGYKAIDGTVFFDSVGEAIEIPLKFELKRSGKRVRKVIILLSLFLLSLFLGFCIGWLASLSRLPKGSTMVSNDTFVQLRDSLVPKNDNIEYLKRQLNQTLSNETEGSIEKTPDDNTLQNKLKLEIKLKGLDFTQEEINAYKQINSCDQDLVKDCNACLTIINAKMKPYTDVNGVKQDPLVFAQKTLLENIKMENHKTAISDFININGKFYNTISSKSKATNYKTIQQAINAYNSNM